MHKKCHSKVVKVPAFFLSILIEFGTRTNAYNRAHSVRCIKMLEKDLLTATKKYPYRTFLFDMHTAINFQFDDCFCFATVENWRIYAFHSRSQPKSKFFFMEFFVWTHLSLKWFLFDSYKRKFETAFARFWCVNQNLFWLIDVKADLVHGMRLSCCPFYLFIHKLAVIYQQ